MHENLSVRASTVPTPPWRNAVSVSAAAAGTGGTAGPSFARQLLSSRGIGLVVFLQPLIRHTYIQAQTARRESIRRCFNDALTGTLSSNARPIELQAHDPLRYTSDMTAWLHQTLAGERELFSRLIPPPTASAAATSKQSISMAVDDADDTETDQMESRRFSHSQTVRNLHFSPCFFSLLSSSL